MLSFFRVFNQSIIIIFLTFLFRFPQDEKRKSKWLEAIGKSEIYAQARICSNHFLKSDYHSNEFSVRNNLLSTAVPSANIPSKSKKISNIIT